MAFQHLNRAQRRAAASYAREAAAKRPDRLTEIPKAEWPPAHPGWQPPERAWHSRRYLAQLYAREATSEGRWVRRLSVCRVTLNDSGHWQDNIEWEELMGVKREIGYGDWYAIEIFPRDRDTVNVANMRHLWLFDEPLSVGWFRESPHNE